MSSLATTWAAAVLALAGGGTAPPAGAPSWVDGLVTGLDLLPAGSRTELVVSVSGAVEIRDFTMEGPDRIVLDVIGGQFEPGAVGVEAAVNRGGVLMIRATQYSPEIVRIVLDMDRPTEYVIVKGQGYVRVSFEDPWYDPSIAFLPWNSPVGALPGAFPTAAGVGTGIAPSAPGTAGVGTPVASVLNARTSQEPRMSVEFQDTPIRDVVYTFSDFSGRSIVLGTGVTGAFSGSINNQPWDIALYTILDAMNLAAREDASGIIQVVTLENLSSRDDLEPVQTRTFRVNYANVTDMVDVVTAMLTERGQVQPYPATNTLVVTDVARVLNGVAELIEGLDTRTPSVAISARINFVNRTELQEAGVIYDLKDSAGNQLNTLTPGGIDRNADGIIDEDEVVEVGTNVVSLGGNSIAALGNANQRIASPSLQFLSTVLLGRRTLITFLEALQSVNLSDVEARPQVTVLDNVQAEIVVGEQTPLRVIDLGSDTGGGGGAGGGVQSPTAAVNIVETGIILRVTPHVVAEGLVWMEIHAERSAPRLTEADLGQAFDQQRVTTRAIVADGATSVMGGLTVTQKEEVRSGIPLLQELPLVGRLFRTTREQTIQRDLVILVTPQIVRD